jgi:LysR family transcriptional regulator (chromosome initiation inhibitor)
MGLDTHQLAAFAAVIREGSFERASRALHVTASAVSQRIKQLEEQVGQVLVVRRTPCVPTRAGEVLYRHALQVALLEADVLAGMEAPDAGPAAAPTTITVAVNADSLATWLVPRPPGTASRPSSTTRTTPRPGCARGAWSARSPPTPGRSRAAASSRWA